MPLGIVISIDLRVRIGIGKGIGKGIGIEIWIEIRGCIVFYGWLFATLSMDIYSKISMGFLLITLVVTAIVVAVNNYSFPNM